MYTYNPLRKHRQPRSMLHSLSNHSVFVACTIALFGLFLLFGAVQAHDVPPSAPPLLPACYTADLRCALPQEPNHSLRHTDLITETRIPDGKWLQLLPELTMPAFQRANNPQPLFDIPCVNGFADVFPCAHVGLLAYLPESAIGGTLNNDLWGWTDPESGREYALVGARDGVVFLDITTPTAPIYLGKLPTHDIASSWRDIKVYRDHAYIVADSNPRHGLQIFDLTELRTVDNPPVLFAETAHYAGFGEAHNIIINEESGFAYALGSDTCHGGLHIVDIRTIRTPTQVGCYTEDGYIHDAQCVIYHGPDSNYHGREICFNASVSQLTIVDVTNKSAPRRITELTTAGSIYIHQGWLTADQRYFLFNDEMDELFRDHNTRSYLLDLQNLDVPKLLGQYTAALEAIDHNLYISNTFIYEANYTSGLRVLDGKEIAQGILREVAYFDTFPDHDQAVFAGAWTAYPYFASGTVVVSTLDRGVFLLKPTPLGDVVIEEPIIRPTLCRNDSATVPYTTTITLQARNDYARDTALTLQTVPIGATVTVSPTILDLRQESQAMTTLTADVSLLATGLHTITLATEPVMATEAQSIETQSNVIIEPTIDTAAVVFHLAEALPPAPTLLSSPAASTLTTTQLLDIPFSWQSEPAAGSYRVEIARDEMFTNLIAYDEIAGSTSDPTYRLRHQLDYNQSYHWRVLPMNGCGIGPAARGQFRTPAAIFLPIVANQ